MEYNWTVNVRRLDREPDFNIVRFNWQSLFHADQIQITPACFGVNDLFHSDNNAVVATVGMGKLCAWRHNNTAQTLSNLSTH